MKLAPIADKIAANVAKKQKSINWSSLRDLIDMETGGELECWPLDTATDMAAKRLVREHRVEVYCAGHQF